MDPKTPIVTLGPVFAMKARLLDKLGIRTLEDFLLYVPFRYEDSSITSYINILQAGETVTIRGRVVKTVNVYTKKGLSIQRITIADDTGLIDCIFFNQRFILNNIHREDFLSAAGRVELFGRKKSLIVRSYEVLPFETAIPIHTGRLVPIYSETQGLSSKWIRGRIRNLLSQKIQIKEHLPDQILKDNRLIDYRTAINSIHFPKNFAEAERARQRLSFDELFLKHTASLIRKKEWQSKKKAIPFEVISYKSQVDALIESLPFELTKSQRRAIDDIFKDLSENMPMNRLLEGDVGSGKTVVAVITMYLAHLNGFQSALMTPTEILANQHYATISSLLEPFGVKIQLFTSSSKLKKKREARSRKRGKNNHDSKFIIHNSADFDIAIGTHALIQERVKFDRLGLVVIDEQQRFGVEQRAVLREKGVNPHLLTMTATPIPRTIFLTIYSDLSLSVLNDMPKGRKKIKTWVVPEEKRKGGYEWISEKIRSEKSQVFIVCPFIEPSETLASVKAAKGEFERLKGDVFPNFKLALLHGKLKAEEKAQVYEESREGLIDILVATPVIEVGIDIPTADIMVIEAAERFGLAQLHQLRGRVGRGDKQSYCFLFTDAKRESSLERLSYLQTINNGPELAEMDLKLRGPGEMFGTMQHGVPDLKIASLSDLPTIEHARTSAEQLFDKLNKYPELKTKVEEINLPKISKD